MLPCVDLKTGAPLTIDAISHGRGMILDFWHRKCDRCPAALRRLNEAAAKRCFEQNTSAALVDDLGIATGEHTDLCNALVPCLKNPTAVLDEEDCRVIAKMCVMLLMSDGNPPAEAVAIARQVAGSVGVQLP